MRPDALLRCPCHVGFRAFRSWWPVLASWKSTASYFVRDSSGREEAKAKALCRCGDVFFLKAARETDEAHSEALRLGLGAKGKGGGGGGGGGGFAGFAASLRGTRKLARRPGPAGGSCCAFVLFLCQGLQKRLVRGSQGGAGTGTLTVSLLSPLTSRRQRSKARI